jgi:hypothetical protein
MQLQPTHNKAILIFILNSVQIVNKEDFGGVMWIVAYFERSLVRFQPLLFALMCVNGNAAKF